MATIKLYLFAAYFRVWYGKNFGRDLRKALDETGS